MKRCYWIAVIPAALTFAALGIVLALFLVKWVWGWTIPDLFPGAVKQGLVAGSISWMTAFKLVVVAALFGGITRGASGKG